MAANRNLDRRSLATSSRRPLWPLTWSLVAFLALLMCCVSDARAYESAALAYATAESCDEHDSLRRDGDRTALGSARRPAFLHAGQPQQDQPHESDWPHATEAPQYNLEDVSDEIEQDDPLAAIARQTNRGKNRESRTAATIHWNVPSLQSLRRNTHQPRAPPRS